jgi:UDP:flavonoid glycosyltransferase YjiC (YdhE family)
LDSLPLTGKRILVAPLNWGLGHATRCMPVINLLMRYGAEVIIGGEGRSLCLLKAAYPNATFIDLPAYNISYSQNSLMVWKTLVDTPRLLKVFKEEHRLLDQLVGELHLNAVLSDNRYGLWTDKIPSVFMCHQLAVIMPPVLSWTRRYVYELHLKYIAKFRFLWIPDHAGENSLSGELTHKYPLPNHARFIGPLSRFPSAKSPGQVTTANQILILLSGPEPQRTILEQKVSLQAAADLGRRYVIVRGITEEQKIREEGNILWYNFLDSQDLLDLVRSSEVIVARSGYSTVMDLAVLGKKALFIPTPGQTEQEYLAQQMLAGQLAAVQQQDNINLVEGIYHALELKGVPVVEPDDNALKDATAEWLGVLLR